MVYRTIIPYLFTILTACLGIYIYNLFLDFYIDDAALYGTLSKHMIETGDFLSLIHNHKDWLDKPHFPFWVAALFFKCFGVSPFSYFLPITLSIFGSFIYTFKFANKYYHKTTAWLSVFVLATAQYTFMASTEGRIEPYLMLAIIASIYHFDAGFYQKKLGHLTLVSVFVAIAIMTKGIFIIVPIFGGIFGHLFYNKISLKELISWRWVFIFLLIFIFILPEIYALYVQFDSQLGKEVFGKKGVSGIRWFLWDSQFSRLINSGPITRSKGDVSFFLHTLVWAFFPWCILLYIAFFKRGKQLFKKDKIAENYTFFGGLFMLMLFSISKFQLPHYISIVFPFYAVLVANTLNNSFSKKEKKIINITQLLFIVLGVFLLFFLTIISKSNIYFTSICILLLVAVIIKLNNIKLTRTIKYVVFSGCISIVLNLYASVNVYAKVSNYRAGIYAAEYLNDNYAAKSVVTIGKIPNVFDFYANSSVTKFRVLPKDEKLESEFVLSFLIDSVSTAKILKDYIIEKRFRHYNQENIQLKFFYPKKRANSLTEFVLYKRKDEAFLTQL
ncbi:ArnT family glycosyltransferase [Polaribacter sp. Asnod6-C07]|uniref:ArnT family glycosyltransferase n=1 Tax=Polaribacter sp. Asnod6-C07 TaxID=3160582 RepID=UPI003869E215